MYGGRVPAFDKPELREKSSNAQDLHQHQQALRRLIRGVRKRLQASGKYDDTILAKLDQYQVKLTELSVNPIVLRPGVQKVDHNGGPSSPERRKRHKKNTTETVVENEIDE
jgi:hypothetical protein